VTLDPRSATRAPDAGSRFHEIDPEYPDRAQGA
jgi:hypothetical protein